MTILAKVEMSGYIDSYQVVKRFNFDGLEIEIIKKDSSKMQSEVEKIQTGENFEAIKNESPIFVCSKCLNKIQNSKKVLLKCQDIFCSTCFIAAINDDKDETIKCPSVLNCDFKISNEEILSIIGEENYEDFMLDRLEKRLDKLNFQMRLDEDEILL